MSYASKSAQASSISSTTYEYLIKKYVDQGLMEESGKTKIHEGASWNPYIYPDNGYIPPCDVCKHNYDQYVALGPRYSKEIFWPHYGFGCLWAEYYEEKLKTLHSDIKFNRK